MERDPASIRPTTLEADGRIQSPVGIELMTFLLWAESPMRDYDSEFLSSGFMLSLSNTWSQGSLNSKFNEIYLSIRPIPEQLPELGGYRQSFDAEAYGGAVIFPELGMHSTRSCSSETAKFV